MSLQLAELEYVILTLLRESKEEMSGYDLRKVISGSFAKWSHQQVYRTLARHVDTLWSFRPVPQEGKPDKKVYTFKACGFGMVTLDRYHAETVLFCGTETDKIIKIQMLEEEIDMHLDDTRPINLLRIAVARAEVKALESSLAKYQ